VTAADLAGELPVIRDGSECPAPRGDRPLQIACAVYVLSNIVGCPPEEVRSGMPVEVIFEQHGDIFIPLFRPREAARA
jgi:hypothetical protein